MPCQSNERGVSSAGHCGGPATPGLVPRQPESIALYTYLLDADGRTRRGVRRPGAGRGSPARHRAGAAGRGRGTATSPVVRDRRARASGCSSSTACWRSRSGSAAGPPRSWSAPGICFSRSVPAADELLERRCGWRALRPTQLAVLDAEFADRVRPFPQIGRIADAPGVPADRSSSTCSARSPRSRGSRSGWSCCCGTWRRAGGGWSRQGSACRCRSPTACSVSWSRPSGRRSRMRSSGSRRPGS